MFKQITTTILIAVFIALLASVTHAQVWTNVPTTNAVGRWGASSVVIGNNFYRVGGSASGFDFNDEFWEYNSVTQAWTRLQNYPGSGRTSTCAFAINGIGYFGMGDDSGSPFNDFWAYNPAGGGTWTQMASFPGPAASVATAFVIGNYGYVGLGHNNGPTIYNDFYQFDPSTGPGGTWTPMDNFPGTSRYVAPGFAIDTLGYVGLGIDSSGLPVDFYSFNPAAPAHSQWKKITPFPGLGRSGTSPFVLCNKGFVALGAENTSGSIIINEVWMYNPAEAPGGSWTRLPDFSGGNRADAQGFVIGDTAYITGGSNNTNNALSDVWDYIPALVTVSPNATICSGSGTVLSANGNSVYTWSPSSGLSTTLTTCDSVPGGTMQTTASPLSTITYTVTEAICSQQYASIMVTVIPGPSISVSANAAICIGSSTALSVTGSASDYTWTPSAGLSSPLISNPTANPTITTTYTVVASNGTCSDERSVKITVNPNPIVYAGINVSITIGQSYTITANSNGLSYSWTPEAVSANGSAAVVKPLSTTQYYVTVTDANGCSATDSVIIYVNLSCNSIFVPDAFSPNGDGINDVFSPMAETPACVESMTFDIYDRWGNKIFESYSLNSAWDGNYKGKTMDNAIFVYSLQATLINGTSVSKKGNISLIK